MIKCPKDFYKMFQDNERFIALMKDAKEQGLSVEVERGKDADARDAFYIRMFNFKWSDSSWGIRYCGWLKSKEEYAKELKDLRNEVDVKKTEIDKIQSGQSIFKNKKDKINSLNDELDMMYKQINYKEYFLGLRSDQTDYRLNNYTYNGIKKDNDNFIPNVLDEIKKMIAEYKGIKFCTDDIILY
jgi:hypothetical protein